MTDNPEQHDENAGPQRMWFGIANPANGAPIPSYPKKRERPVQPDMNNADTDPALVALYQQALAENRVKYYKDPKGGYHAVMVTNPSYEIAGNGQIVDPEGNVVPPDKALVNIPKRQEPATTQTLQPSAPIVDTRSPEEKRHAVEMEKAWAENRVALYHDRKGNAHGIVLDDASYHVGRNGEVFDSHGRRVRNHGLGDSEPTVSAHSTKRELVDALQQIIAPDTHDPKLMDKGWGKVTEKALQDKLESVQKKHGLEATGRYDDGDEKLKEALRDEFGVKKGQTLIDALDGLKKMGVLSAEQPDQKIDMTALKQPENAEGGNKKRPLAFKPEP